MTSNPLPSGDDVLSLLSDLIAAARKAGADAADAMLYDSAGLSLSQRLGQPEKLERAESCDLGLRVLIGRCQAVVSCTDRKPAALAEMVERAVAMARLVPEDPFCGLAEPEQLAHDWPDLDLNDGVEPSAESLIEQARGAEEAALAVAGVTNSEGAEASWGRTRLALAASNGFAGSYAITRHSLAVSVIAGSGTGMERDYDFDSKVHATEMGAAVEIGRRAGERAVRRLNPRKLNSQKLPVIFDPRVSQSLLGHLSSAISGSAVARGTSFLMNCLGQTIFAPGVTVVDDPRLRRGLRSRPFDGEGVAVARRAVIDGGRLTTWLMDLRSSRQLGLTSTGHGSRGTGGPPHPAPTNLYMLPGLRSPAELIGEIKHGFYITDLLGMGVSGITGDYSRGAAGFLIENGVLTWPVSEVTIAGNLKDMFLALEPANDLVFRYGIDVPTVRIDGLMVAGT
ncbi:PmbA protein [uncultured Gammaproteobacteria bacterium]